MIRIAQKQGELVHIGYIICGSYNEEEVKRVITRSILHYVTSSVKLIFANNELCSASNPLF